MLTRATLEIKIAFSPQPTFNDFRIAMISLTIFQTIWVYKETTVVGTNVHVKIRCLLGTVFLVILHFLFKLCKPTKSILLCFPLVRNEEVFNEISHLLRKLGDQNPTSKRFLALASQTFGHNDCHLDTRIIPTILPQYRYQ